MTVIALKKIGITGGTGLLGKLLVKGLKREKKSYSLFTGDIFKKKQIIEWLTKNNNIEYIFHFAAYASAENSKKNKKKAFRTNVVGTENLLSVLKLKKKKIILFFSSSSHVYKYSKKPIKESFTLEPISYYGKTKLLAEKNIRKKKNILLKYCIARIFSIFHDNQKKPFLYPSIKHKLKKIKSKKIRIKGANNVRDFTNAEKVIKVIYKLFAKKSVGIYNIGSGKGMTIKKFINKNINKKKIVFDDQKPNFLVADIKKLKKEIKI